MHGIATDILYATVCLDTINKQKLKKHLPIYFFVTVGNFFLGSSCEGRCNKYVDNSYSCQCNSHCEGYGDCCDDYLSSW